MHAAQNSILYASGVHTLDQNGHSAVALSMHAVYHGLCRTYGYFIRIFLGVVGARVLHGRNVEIELLGHHLENPSVVPVIGIHRQSVCQQIILIIQKSPAIDPAKIVGLLGFQDVLDSHVAPPDVNRQVVEFVAEVAASAARDDEELVGSEI